MHPDTALLVSFCVCVLPPPLSLLLLLPLLLLPLLSSLLLLPLLSSLLLLPLLSSLLLLPTGGHLHPVPGDVPPPHLCQDAHQWAQV
jgi:hypothetical protein